MSAQLKNIFPCAVALQAGRCTSIVEVDNPQPEDMKNQQKSSVILYVEGRVVENLYLPMLPLS